MVSRWKMKNCQYYKNCDKGECNKEKNIYPNCILMEEPSHSFTIRSLPRNSFIAFRISLALLAHLFETDFIFKINSSSFSKRVFNLFLYTFVFPLFQKKCSRGLLCGDFGTHILDKITGIWRHPILGTNLFMGIFYWKWNFFFNCLIIFTVDLNPNLRECGWAVILPPLLVFP